MAAQLPARPAVHAAALADKLYTPVGGKPGQSSNAGGWQATGVYSLSARAAACTAGLAGSCAAIGTLEAISVKVGYFPSLSTTQHVYW